MSEKLLKQGGYGCVYFPAKSCLSNQNIDNTKFVTKVQMNDRNIRQELKISEYVRTISNNSSFFAPVIESCPVMEKEISAALLDNNNEPCEITRTAQKAGKSLIMMRIPYIPDGDFAKHLTSSTISELVSCYRHLLLGVEHLINRKIVHYDLKYDNILFIHRLNNPIIIDFGLSIDMRRYANYYNDINMLKKVFYVYEPKYSLWPLDVHLICFIVQKHESGGVNISEIKNMCHTYVINAYKSAIDNNVLTSDQQEMYTKSVTYYSQFADKPIHNVLNTLLNNWNTWDIYGLHYMFYTHIKKNIIYDSRHKALRAHILELMKEQLDPDSIRKTTEELMVNVSESYYLTN